MVDSAINWLFVDLNSYFASIEQELCPELRGQPIAIVPIRIEAQTGCCRKKRSAIRQLLLKYIAKRNRCATRFESLEKKPFDPPQELYCHDHSRAELVTAFGICWRG
jgi:nucleotidyltransferase/DNA polymerase involved in DNA repair